LDMLEDLWMGNLIITLVLIFLVTFVVMFLKVGPL
jgi:hypothetical protein